MQPGGKVKRIQEYEIGERVYDGDVVIGRVVAVDEHPDRRSVGYLLIEDNGHYTTMRGATDVRQWLCVARAVPESVAMYFAEVVLGKDVKPRVKRKFPVVGEEKVEEVEEGVGGVERDEPESPVVEDLGLAPMPYIDAV